MIGLLKPCYVFAPSVLLRRAAQWLQDDDSGQRLVRLPWGAELDVNGREVIGRALIQQNSFDIAVSEVAWRLLEAGDRVVDAGANIGYMTSLFAARVGRTGHVDSFEPHPQLLLRLRQNVARLTNAAAITVHGCALGDSNGTARLLEPDGFDGNEGMAAVADAHALRPERETRGFDVPIARLDTVLAGDPIALLKVDVEGFEARVLAGAERLLATGLIRNVIYEAHECERSAVHPLLRSRGYTIFGIGYGLLGPRMTAGIGAPEIERSWESPSYLATLEPGSVLPRLRSRGWRVLRRGQG